MRILDILTEKIKITNDDREEWIDNDQSLYDYWKETGLSKIEFMTQYKYEIDSVISRVLDQQPHRHDPTLDGSP